MFKYITPGKIKLIASIAISTGILCGEDYILNLRTIKEVRQDISKKVKDSLPDQLKDKIELGKQKKQQMKEWAKEKLQTSSENVKKISPKLGELVQKKKAKRKSQQSTQSYIQIKVEPQINNISSKKEKLRDRHIILGVVSMVGSIFMPKSYFIIFYSYLTAYQLYFLSHKFKSMNQQYGLWSHQHQFLMAWYIYMFASVLVPIIRISFKA